MAPLAPLYRDAFPVGWQVTVVAGVVAGISVIPWLVALIFG